MSKALPLNIESGSSVCRYDYYKSELTTSRETSAVGEMKKATLFLEVARDAVVDPYGRGVSAGKFGADHHIETLEAAPFAPGMFDAIAMSDAPEHELMDKSISFIRIQNRLRACQAGRALTPRTKPVSSVTLRMSDMAVIPENPVAL